MNDRVLYMGDDDLGGAGIYLAGVMAHFGIEFDYLPSAEGPGARLDETYAGYILSDYPARNFSQAQMANLVGKVCDGAGLLMIGGWESFHGREGEYNRTVLAEALPVEILEEDDRVNCSSVCLIKKMADHPILENLPFDSPPGIGGYNRFAPKRGALTLLQSVEVSAHLVETRFEFAEKKEAPLLVTGSFGLGRTAALATDVAPHWVGGLVDWGGERIVQKVGDGFIEVGEWYARFFRNLVAWVGGK